MDSNEIKTKILHYWRFTRKGYSVVATEVGKFNSDILISNEKEIIECEVKISKHDLRKEFDKKKHDIYKNPSKWYSNWIPNKFYFAVPEELKSYTLDITENTNYGIIIVLDKKISKNKREIYCNIFKKASVIQPFFQKKLYQQIVLRSSSELVRNKIENILNQYSSSYKSSSL